LLASASDDQTIRFWNVAKREEINVLNGHRAEVKSISFSSDNQLLASGDSSGQVAVWNYPEIMSNFTLDNLLERSCDWLRGYLKTNPNVEESDRRLCDDSPAPSQQTTIVPTNTPISSAPSIVQPSVQNAPSLTPPSNNGQNNYRQAPRDRNQVSKLSSTSVETHINQGLTYHRQRNYQQAISRYSKAIALNPNSDKAYSNRAAAYNEQKDYQKAIADSSKAISLNPTYANAYINRGLAYYRQGNSQQAIANYNKAIELAPDNAITYTNRALAYTRLGKQQAAQEDKRKAAVLSQRQSQ
jgi:tetratricopeptide (TPR) repeat protein